MAKNLNIVELASDRIKDEKSIQEAVANILEQPAGTVVVLVSALGQTHRTLMEAGEKSADQDLVLASALAEGLRTYHVQLAQQVTEPVIFRETRSLLSGLFEELSDLLKGLYLLEEFTEQAREVLSRYGERASAIIIAHVLRSKQIQANCFYTRELFCETGNLREEIQDLTDKEIIPVLPLSLRSAIASS